MTTARAKASVPYDCDRLISELAKVATVHSWQRYADTAGMPCLSAELEYNGCICTLKVRLDYDGIEDLAERLISNLATFSANLLNLGSKLDAL